jgi:osmoprotectant transport system substrate-binding protein
LITRRRSIEYLIGATFLLQGCAATRRGTVRVGSTNSGENQTIAEIYAMTLERAKIPVERRMRLGDAREAMEALQRREIDVYPGEVRTGAMLDGAPKAFYERRYGVTWLHASPANLGACMATSQYAAEQYALLTLSACATLAPRLRLAATSEFVARGGPLDRLKAAYGGFHFKTVSICDPDTQYALLNRDDADVANGITTAPDITEDQLVILADDRHVWPEYHPAPVVRMAALSSHPELGVALNHVSRALTVYVLQQMSMRRDILHMDPPDLAEDFLRAHARI